MSKLKIGWSEESITPDRKIRLAGQFYERFSEYVETEITATAMAVEADGDEMIIISADMTNIPEHLIKKVRDKFSRMIDTFDVNKLIVAATHTHTSHVIATGGIQHAKKILEEYIPKDKEYRSLVREDKNVLTPEEATEFVAEKIALSAKNAWENREEAYYANEFGRAAVGMCRRVSYDDGSAKMWGDVNTANFASLEGGNDSGIELLYTFDRNKELKGIVANIACPAQILEHRSFISADFWGRTKVNLKERFGENIFLLGLCGAAGDQCPRDLVRWVEPESPINDPNIKRPNVLKRKADPSMFDIAGCNRVGKRIANEIISVYEEIEDLKDEIVFQHKILQFDLPLRKATIAEYDAAVSEVERYIDKNRDKEFFNYEDNAKMHVHCGTIARFREQQFKEIHSIETHIIRFGNIVISTNPFELFLDYGNRIKARSYAEQTFIVQLCCGSDGYLPTEKAEKAGHYSAYISSGTVGHDGGDIFVRKTLKEINEMFK